MTGTVASPRRWVLPSVLIFAMLLKQFGNEGPTVSLRRGAGQAQYYQCPRCKRVELWPPRSKGTVLRCHGSSEDKHDEETHLLKGENPKATDTEHFFKPG